ncbi:hypothetical protein [uncultured Methanocorpusculum sp.]|nr:hypothetical protein [uncultured Methanocorpusculum sp.]
MREEVTSFIEAYVKDASHLRKPLVGFADCTSPMFPGLKTTVMPGHLMPGHLMPAEILSDPTVVISYFLFFAVST